MIRSIFSSSRSMMSSMMALGECYVLLEQVEIEVGIRFERIDYI